MSISASNCCYKNEVSLNEKCIVVPQHVRTPCTLAIVTVSVRMMISIVRHF